MLLNACGGWEFGFRNWGSRVRIPVKTIWISEFSMKPLAPYNSNGYLTCVDKVGRFASHITLSLTVDLGQSVVHRVDPVQVERVTSHVYFLTPATEEWTLESLQQVVHWPPYPGSGYYWIPATIASPALIVMFMLLGIGTKLLCFYIFGYRNHQWCLQVCKNPWWTQKVLRISSLKSRILCKYLHWIQ